MVLLKQKWMVIIPLDILAILFGMFFPEKMLIILILVVWSNGLLYSVENLEKRGALFAFLISFFLILIGRQTLETFGLHEVEIEFSDELNRHAEKLMLISLVSLFIGYYFANRYTFGRKKEIREFDYNSSLYICVQNVSAVLFYLTFAFNIFTVLDIVFFVIKHGYIALYSSYVSSVPYIIKKIGDMCLVCFWIFLATMPKKRKVDELSVYYLLYLFLTLGTGKRFPFVSGLLTLFVYYVARNRINSGDQLWLRRSTMIWLFLLAPVLIAGLYLIGQIRVDNLASSLRLDKVFTDFLYNQGISVNIIKRAKLYENLLPQGKLYLFGSTYEAVSNNVIFRLLGATSYSGNNAAHALNGYSFQHAISYATMGKYYLSGHGLGSCYIAEAFHDLQYFGVIIVNIVYGIMFRKVFDFRQHGIWATAIILSMLYSLLLAPRGSADGFITDIVDLTTWGTILVVWLLSRLVYTKNRLPAKRPVRSITK